MTDFQSGYDRQLREGAEEGSQICSGCWRLVSADCLASMGERAASEAMDARSGMACCDL